MLAILTIVAPVFGVILLGFLAVRARYLSEGADRIVNELGYKIVMPAFLFQTMVTAAPLADPPLVPIVGYFSAMFLTWAAALILTRLVLRRPGEDGAAIAMGACFGNTVMLGIPLAVSAFGAQAASMAAIIVAVDTPLLWLVATLNIELAGRKRVGISPAALVALVRDLLSNPIILAVLLGLAYRASGWPVPPLAAKFIGFLAAAALPVSLIALGMSLARFELKGQVPTLVAICLLKMMLYPLAAYIMLQHVLAAPPAWVKMGVLFASMPVGANAFMFAAKYDRAVGSVSAAIGLSTALAAFTVTGVLYLVTVMGL